MRTMNHSLRNDEPNKRTEHCVLGVQFSFISCTFSTLQVNYDSMETRANKLVFLRISKIVKWSSNSVDIFPYSFWWPCYVIFDGNYLNHGTKMKNKIDRLNGSLWVLNEIKSLNVQTVIRYGCRRYPQFGQSENWPRLMHTLIQVPSQRGQ